MFFKIKFLKRGIKNHWFSSSVKAQMHSEKYQTRQISNSMVAYITYNLIDCVSFKTLRIKFQTRYSRRILRGLEVFAFNVQNLIGLHFYHRSCLFWSGYLVSRILRCLVISGLIRFLSNYGIKRSLADIKYETWAELGILLAEPR